MAAYGPATWYPHFVIFPCFVETIKGHNFLIRHLFEVVQFLLESSHRALHNEVVSISIRDYQFFSILDPPGSR